MENILNNLNTFLSDLNVFYRKLQNYHWNIKGKDFFVIHSKLEEYYNEMKNFLKQVIDDSITYKFFSKKNKKHLEKIFKTDYKKYYKLEILKHKLSYIFKK